MSAVSVSGHGERRRGRRRAVAPSLGHEPAVGEQHPDRLDRVQRHAVGARSTIAPDGRLGQPGHEAAEQLAHGRTRAAARGRGS